MKRRIRNLDILEVILPNSMNGKGVFRVYQPKVEETARVIHVQTPRAKEKIAAPVVIFLKR